MSFKATFNKVTLENLIYIVLVFLGVIYVLNNFSPSSYGFFLDYMGESDTGLIWGHPRNIRSDEWSVLTPLTQALVNSHFQQFNSTSLYGESFRIAYGLPIYDWGLLFKPTMWGYLVLPPSYAYSLHYYLLFAIFIVGYFKLFKLLKLDSKLSLMLTFILYFSGFSQFWWSVNAASFSLFPWVLVVLFNQRLSYVLRLVLFYWLSVSWFLLNLYPAFIISLSFVGGLIFLCIGKEWFNWKKILSLSLVSGLAVLTALYYLQDYLVQTSATIYPGSRSFSGGTAPIREVIAQFQPFSMYDKNFNPIQANICEIGVVSFPFILMALCHLDWKSLRITNRKWLSILGFGLLLMLIWMVFPVPNSLGKLFLWNYVDPNRMEYAEGLLLGVATVLFFSQAKYVINVWRFILYAAIVFSLWFFLTKPFFGFSLSSSLDLWLILAVVLSYILTKYTKLPLFYSFMLFSVIIMGAVNGRFNPIQSSSVIFKQDFKVKNELNNYINKDGVLVYSNPVTIGATLNGLGYKSLSHLTAVPQLDFWRKQYPNLENEEFNEIFNRYSHIILDLDTQKPFSPQSDVVKIPLQDFMKIYYPIDKYKDNSKSPNVLYNNDSTNFSIRVPNGNLSTLLLFIGNYGNTSNGTISLEICSNNLCHRSERELSSTRDNDYITFKLDKVIPVLDNTITLKLSLSNSTNPVAIWSGEIEGKEGLYPKIKLIYE